MNRIFSTARNGQCTYFWGRDFLCETIKLSSAVVQKLTQDDSKKLKTMKRNSIKYYLLASVAVLAVSTCGGADLLYTFDTGSSGADGGGFNAGTYAWSSTYQAVQQTLTSSGWTMGSGGGPGFEFSWPSQTTMQAIANAGDGRVSFDMFVNQSSFTVGTWADWDWYQFHFAANSDGSIGWQQDDSNILGHNAFDGNYDAGISPHGGNNQSVHFDLGFAQMGWQPGDSYFQLAFGSNSGGNDAVQFYVDNIHVYEVPEPSMFALAGLGAMGLLISRRRK